MTLFKEDDFGQTVKGLVEPAIRTVWTDDKGEK
jgi:hypothetical protein